MTVIASLTRKLERLGPLSDEDRQALDDVQLDIRPVEAGAVLVLEGERPAGCLLLLDGFACRYKLLDEGRRQIVSFQVPGDLCDLTSLLLPRADHSIAALTQARVALVPHPTVLGWLERHRSLGQALWRDAQIDAAIFREWVVNVGRRTSLQRVAHVLCELVVRMRTAGLSDGDRCELPITHAELADATGLATVHVNRALQELRAGDRIEMDGKCLLVRDWPGLKAVAGFDPRYLHQLAADAA